MAKSRTPPRRKASAKTAGRASGPDVGPKRGAAAPRRPSPPAGTVARSTTFVWRRLHDGHIIAQVTPVRGMGSWQVSAFRTAKPDDSVRGPRAFSHLREAHLGADELVRDFFSHECRTGVCGRWLRWPEE